MIQFIKSILYILLEFLNKWSDKNENEKFVKSFLMDGVEVYNGSQWSPAIYIHQIKPEPLYKLETIGGLELEGADDHLIYTNSNQTRYLKDLKPGDMVKTVNGCDVVKKVYNTKYIRNLLDVTVANEKESYITNNILSHNTTTSAIFLLHYICFNIDKNSLVLGNKRKTAVEILDKIKKIYFELPFFLKPGVYKWNEGEVVLDNGCRIMAEATTVNSGIGFTFHCVLADEFAHVPPNILDDFYNNLFPTVTAAKAKFIITSTQNGYNLFYRLYKAAEAGENDYKAFKTDWYEVPEWNPELKCWEKRDDEWHRKQVANYGSEEAFNKQFGTNFDLAADTLIAQKVLNKKARSVKQFERKDLPGVLFSDYFYWHPDFDPTTQLRHSYLIFTTDLAEGLKQDRTVSTIWRMVKDGEVEEQVVGYFESDTLTREQVVIGLCNLMALYCNHNNILFSMEYNTYGELFYNAMEDYLNTDTRMVMNGMGIDIVLNYEQGSKLRPGIKLNHANKADACILFKEDYERGVVKNESSNFFRELNNFSDAGNNKFRAAFGHDDHVMSSIQIEFVKSRLRYKILREEFESQMEVSDSSDNLNLYYNNISYMTQPFENQYSFFQNNMMPDDYYNHIVQDRLKKYN